MAVEIVGDRRMAGSMFRPQKRHARPAYQRQPRVSTSGSVPGDVTGAYRRRQATAEDLYNLEGKVVNIVDAALEVTQQHRDEADLEILREVDTNDEQIRGELYKMLAGGIKARAIGAILLAAGIVLSVIGSVISAGS